MTTCSKELVGEAERSRTPSSASNFQQKLTAYNNWDMGLLVAVAPHHLPVEGRARRSRAVANDIKIPRMTAASRGTRLVSPILIH